MTGWRLYHAPHPTVSKRSCITFIIIIIIIIITILGLGFGLFFFKKSIIPVQNPIISRYNFVNVLYALTAVIYQLADVRAS